MDYWRTDDTDFYLVSCLSFGTKVIVHPLAVAQYVMLKFNKPKGDVALRSDWKSKTEWLFDF